MKYLLAILFVLSASFAYADQQIFTSSGNFTVPNGTTSIFVEVWGGGGNGATIAGSGGGGGGGGGAYSASLYTVSPGVTYNFTVAQSGTGGDTYFNTTSTLLAKGGSNGSLSVAGAGGQAASGVGSTKYSGGSGGAGLSSSPLSPGSGGGAAGSTSDGGTGNTGSGAAGGAGGVSGGGTGAASVTQIGSNGNGIAATGVGGGGSGGWRSSGAAGGGGAGAAGQVIISYGNSNVYIYDESTDRPITGINVTVLISGTLVGYNYTTTTGSLSALLVNDTYTITYYADGYSQRQRVFDLDSNSTLILYLLNSSLDDLMLVTVVDSINERVRNVTVDLEKKNLSGTNYYTVENCVTDALGQCLLHVNLYDTTYNVELYYQDELKLDSGDTRFSDTEQIYVISVDEAVLTDFFNSNSIRGNVTHNASYFRFNYTAGGGITYGCLAVYTREGTTYELHNSSCSTALVDAISLPYNNATDDEWIAIGYFILESGLRYPLDADSVVTSAWKAQFGRNGLYLFGFLLMGVVLFSALYHPVAPFVFAPIFTFIMNGLGFISVGTPAAISLLIISLFGIILLKRS